VKDAAEAAAVVEQGAGVALDDAAVVESPLVVEAGVRVLREMVDGVQERFRLVDAGDDMAENPGLVAGREDVGRDAPDLAELTVVAGDVAVGVEYEDAVR
jgi:hypothetical protein